MLRFRFPRKASVVFTLAFAVACGPDTPSSTPLVLPGPTETTPATGAVAPILTGINPERIRIPAIGVDSAIIDLGLEPSGELEVPKGEQYDLVGWWSGGSKPGASGPAVLAGHIDDKTGPSVFHRLSQLKAGDVVEISDLSGETITYQVERTQQVDKDAFPRTAVYGLTPEPRAVLVTCGGIFDRNSGHYKSNVIVYAKLVDA